MKFKRSLAVLLILALLLGALPALAEYSMPYYIEVDLTNQIVTIYNTRDNTIARQMLCSAGVDNKTPTGVYRFTRAFGIAPDPGSRMPYTRINDSHYWVGDSASPLYNRFASVVGGDAPFDTTQSEHLIDYAQAYRYCLSISYNEAGQPGRGSAIFLHCYPENPYTGGCIAVPEEAMKTIMRRVHEKCLLVIDRRENLASY